MIKTKSPQTKKEFEPRFKVSAEPTVKKPYFTYKNEFYMWNGKDWELMSVRYGEAATGQITMEVAKWMKTEEYKKLAEMKKK